VEFAEQLRAARIGAGLSQAQLARRAGTSQSRISTYEQAVVVPELPTQERLMRAARPLPSKVLDQHRSAVKRLAARNRLSNVRVFGSVARGDDHLHSDIDLLVTPEPTASLVNMAAFVRHAEKLLGYHVDVESDARLDPDSPIAREALTL
jgi:hypothetical protein